VGGVLGGILLIAAVLIVLCLRHRKKNQHNALEAEEFAASGIPPNPGYTVPPVPAGKGSYYGPATHSVTSVPYSNDGSYPQREHGAISPSQMSRISGQTYPEFPTPVSQQPMGGTSYHSQPLENTYHQQPMSNPQYYQPPSGPPPGNTQYNPMPPNFPPANNTGGMPAQRGW